MRNFSILASIFFPFFALFSQTKQTISQTEVYIWGIIFFCLSMGSLLLIVYLFPKNEIYKKQKQSQKEQRAQKISAPPSPQKPEVETTAPQTVTTLVTSPQQTEEQKDTSTKTDSKTIQTELPKSTPSIPNITQSETEVSKPTSPPPIPPQPQVVSTELPVKSFDFLFKTKNLTVENTIREFLSKIYLIVPSKSISVYFVKNQQFTRFMERRGESINLYDPIAERSDLSEEVILFLKKKLGAFSSTHSDVVLPLIAENQLYGGVKIVFLEPQKNFNIGPVWSEIKQFAKQFYTTFLGQQSIERDSLLSVEHFQNILSYRVTLDISQNLTLIKVVNSVDKPQTLTSLGEVLKEILGKKPEVYKLSEDTIGIFLTIEAREKLGKSLGELLTKLRKQINNVDLCVGSVDYNSKYQTPQKWLEKAQSALAEAVKAGPNNYKLLAEKN